MMYVKKYSNIQKDVPIPTLQIAGYCRVQKRGSEKMQSERRRRLPVSAKPPEEEALLLLKDQLLSSSPKALAAS